MNILPTAHDIENWAGHESVIMTQQPDNPDKHRTCQHLRLNPKENKQRSKNSLCHVIFFTHHPMKSGCVIPTSFVRLLSVNRFVQTARIKEPLKMV